MTKERANLEIKLLRDYISDLGKGLESSLNLNKAKAERNTDNEPVAWMQKLQNYVTGETVFSFEKERIGINDIQLYTHPAKTQELLAEIAALKMMLANRNEIIDKLDLKSTPCKYTEGM